MPDIPDQSNQVDPDIQPPANPDPNPNHIEVVPVVHDNEDGNGGTPPSGVPDGDNALVAQLVRGLTQALKPTMTSHTERDATATVVGNRRPYKKVSAFSSARPTDWLNWRHHFLQVVRINGWSDLEQRQQAAAAMEGEALSYTRDINPEPDVQHPSEYTIEDLLAEYEEVFMPRSESDTVVAEFNCAKQKADEDILRWSTRLRTLFIRSYPEENPDGVLLINRFVLGLRDKEVVSYVHENQPTSYFEARELAQRKAATKAFVHSSWQSTHGRSPGVGQVGNEGQVGNVAGKGRGQRMRERALRYGGIPQTPMPHLLKKKPACYFCESEDHVQVDCAAYKAARNRQAAPAARGARGGGRGGGRGWRGQRPSRPGGARVGAIPALEEEGVAEHAEEADTTEKGN